MSEISEVRAREILDSGGNPSLEWLGEAARWAGPSVFLGRS